MRITISKTSEALGVAAAKCIAEGINAAIAAKGEARIVLSTGASQFATLEALIKSDVDFSKVVMFHLDEYAGLPDTHPASFRKYLRERFIGKVALKGAHLVDGTPENISALSALISESPVDVGVIGIGENAHIAFNDPPADFETEQPYIIVELNEACKRQQVREGWFATSDDVPKRAVSMSPRQIMKCRRIVSPVPYAVKANAIKLTLENAETNLIPATLMKSHHDFNLFVEEASFAATDEAKIVCPTECVISK